MSVYAGTKMAVRAIAEGLRQESDGRWRVTTISPGMTETAHTREAGNADWLAMAMPADAVARAMAYAIEQPDEVDVGEVVIRPTAQA